MGRDQSVCIPMEEGKISSNLKDFPAFFYPSGHNVDDCMRRFFYMKDRVFSGPRPFDNENFEKLSKETFPEHIKVADVKGPK